MFLFAKSFGREKKPRNVKEKKNCKNIRKYFSCNFRIKRFPDIFFINHVREKKNCQNVRKYFSWNFPIKKISVQM